MPTTKAQPRTLAQIDGKTWGILESCDNATNGHFYCLTHQLGFQNALGADQHTDKGRHKLVWVCHEHGPETP